jgi:hypothetical protein
MKFAIRTLISHHGDGDAHLHRVSARHGTVVKARAIVWSICTSPSVSAEEGNDFLSLRLARSLCPVPLPYCCPHAFLALHRSIPSLSLSGYKLTPLPESPPSLISSKHCECDTASFVARCTYIARTTDLAFIILTLSCETDSLISSKDTRGVAAGKNGLQNSSEQGQRRKSRTTDKAPYTYIVNTNIQGELDFAHFLAHFFRLPSDVHVPPSLSAASSLQSWIHVMVLMLLHFLTIHPPSSRLPTSYPAGLATQIIDIPCLSLHSSRPTCLPHLTASI